MDEIIVLKSTRQENWNIEGQMDCYGGLPFRYVGTGRLDYVTEHQKVEGEHPSKSIAYWYFKKSEVDIPKTVLLHVLLERWN